MMLLYIQMFTKLGDDFGAQLLEGNREKHTTRYRHDVLFMDCPSQKNNCF